MNHRIITISREFDSGGRTTGKKTAECLESPCYDDESRPVLGNSAKHYF